MSLPSPSPPTPPPLLQPLLLLCFSGIPLSLHPRVLSLSIPDLTALLCPPECQGHATWCQWAGGTSLCHISCLHFPCTGIPEHQGEVDCEGTGVQGRPFSGTRGVRFGADDLGHAGDFRSVMPRKSSASAQVGISSTPMKM